MTVGLSLEEPLVDILKQYDKENSPLYPVFEAGNLKELNTRIDVPLVQLLDARYCPRWSRSNPMISWSVATLAPMRPADPEGLAEVAEYAMELVPGNG